MGRSARPVSSAAALPISITSSSMWRSLPDHPRRGGRLPPAAHSTPLSVRAILSPFLFLFVASGAIAAEAQHVWHVSDAATLAAAINGSAAGDEIVLAHNAKAYPGPIVLKASQTLTGAAGDPAPIISAADGVAITASGGATIRNVVVNGNGTAAGVRVTGGNVVIDRCSFRDNVSAVEVAAGETANVAITITSNHFEH